MVTSHSKKKKKLKQGSVLGLMSYPSVFILFIGNTEAVDGSSTCVDNNDSHFYNVLIAVTD